MFLDETGVLLGMTRTYARSPNGSRVYDLKPFSREARVTVIGAISLTKVVALMTLDESYECEHCVDACLGTMPECARLCRDCTQMCWTIASYISRASQFISQVMTTCISICEAYAQECEQHDYPHCQKCAQACRQAISEYSKVATSAGAARETLCYSYVL